MEAQSKTLEKAIPNVGKPIKREAKPKLSQEDEFGILLSQINSCRTAGLDMNWVKLTNGNVVALVMPSVKFCQNQHLYIGEKCNYCEM